MCKRTFNRRMSFLSYNFLKDRRDYDLVRVTRRSGELPSTIISRDISRIYEKREFRGRGFRVLRARLSVEMAQPVSLEEAVTYTSAGRRIFNARRLSSGATRLTPVQLTIIMAHTPVATATAAVSLPRVHIAVRINFTDTSPLASARARPPPGPI